MAIKTEQLIPEKTGLKALRWLLRKEAVKIL
jgi:hypothetical protein